MNSSSSLKQKAFPRRQSLLGALVLGCTLMLTLPAPAWAKRSAPRTGEEKTASAADRARGKALAATPPRAVSTLATLATPAIRDDDFVFGRDPFQVNPRLRTGRSGMIAGDDIRLRARMGNTADLEIDKARYVVRNGELLSLPGDAVYRVEVGTDAIWLRAINHSYQDVVVR